MAVHGRAGQVQRALCGFEVCTEVVHVGCLPIVDERQHPIGIITKFDLVEQFDAAMQLANGGCPLPSDLRVQRAR